MKRTGPNMKSFSSFREFVTSQARARKLHRHEIVSSTITFCANANNRNKLCIRAARPRACDEHSWRGTVKASNQLARHDAGAPAKKHKK